MLKSTFNILLILIIVSCTNQETNNRNVDFDFNRIKERGKLIALTGYNAYSYFIYKGQPMGYEYELVNKLSEFLNVKLEIKIVKNIDKMFEMLYKGEGDLIAFNLTITKSRAKQVSFTTHHLTTRQVLVQRKPKNWRNMMLHVIEKKLIRSTVDLIGKTIVVRNASAYLERLAHLSEEIGGNIKVIEADPELTTDDLIEMVANGEIDYTIADKNVARLNQAYYSNIDFKTDISLDQRVGWAVRKNAVQLRDTINYWLGKLKKKVDYYAIYNRYFKNRNAFRVRRSSLFFASTSGKISKYDELLKKYSKKINWDWRLIASLIYQESQFNPNAKSWAGAVGLMQLMPSTIKQYKVNNPLDPVQNIKAGIRHLNWLDRFWKKNIKNKFERAKFVLASYNVGLGHILDARRLAIKFKADSTKWYNNVEKYLLKKSQKKFYNDPVVKYGYCRGIETSNYVKQIFNRYSHYKQFVIKDSIKTPPADSLAIPRKNNSKG